VVARAVGYTPGVAESERDVRKRLGASVKRLRVAAKLTQAELAERAGVEPRTVQRLEAGVSARLSTLVVVARALDVGVGAFFDTRSKARG
jgi:transcriptional regulator with XRE-family HTH domain